MRNLALHVKVTSIMTTIWLVGCMGNAAPTVADASDMLPADDDYDPELTLQLLEKPWQRELSLEIGKLEDAAEAFIASSSDLYELLINDELGPIKKRMPQIDVALQQSAQRYTGLATEAEHLLQRLEQDDIRAVIATIPTGTKDYQEVQDVLRRFRAEKGQIASYAAVQGRLMTSPPFSEAIPVDPGMTSIASTQRDALALLDYLRSTSHALATVSSTVTQWIIDTQPDGHPSGLSMESLSH